jgi:hypothetical protein
MSLPTKVSRFIALGIPLLMVAPVFAQPRPRGSMMQQQQAHSASKEGKLISTGQNQIQMSTDKNETCYVMVGPKTDVSVTGTAEQDYLKSGVMVEFVAEIDKTHTAKEKIIHLYIVSSASDRPAGLFPPDFSVPEKKGKKGDDGAAEPSKPPAADPGFGDTAPAKGRKSRGKKDVDPFGDVSPSKSARSQSSSPQFPGSFTVRGTIKMCKDGKITVAPGRGPTIKAEVAGDATIDVNMADIRVAQRDDLIKVTGMANPSARPNMPTVLMAESVKIELAKPLSGAKKRTTRPERPNKAPKAKKDAGEPDDLLGGK